MGFGIYYDDPKKVVDKTKCRMVGGIVLSNDEVDSEHTKQFLKNNKRFRYKYLKPCPCLFTYFPYYNYASFRIASDRIFPELRKFLRKNPKYEDQNMS